MRDTIRVEPKLFDADEDPANILSFLIDAKYANKVVPNVGLCVCVFDFLKNGESHIYPGDGSAHIELEFRLVVFRPFENEVLEGTIKECTPNGVKVSLGFFADIWIPPWLLQQPSSYDELEGLWVWKYSDDAEEEGTTAEGEKFYMDVNEKIRFRVVSVQYTTLSKDANTGTTTATITGRNQMNGPALLSPPPSAKDRGRSASMDWANVSMETMQPPPTNRQRSKSIEVKGDQELPPAMTVVASIRDDGLGLVSWWPDESEYDGEEQAEEE